MGRRDMTRKVLTAMLLTVFITGIAASGILYRPDNAVSDRLYQRTSSHDPEIVIFGIDQETLDVLGPADGLRGVMARTVSLLNAEEKDRPAVIGIDVMYTGESPENPEADRLLAEAAGQYDNVVTAADIRFGNEYTETDSGLYQVRTGQVLGIYEPYGALKEAADYGIVNALLDRDGIFRHALLYADVPDEGRIYSLRIRSGRNGAGKTECLTKRCLPFPAADSGIFRFHRERKDIGTASVFWTCIKAGWIRISTGTKSF